MHATYCFLHRIDDFDIDIEADSLGFNENNWYQAMATITDKGEVIQLCNDNDWRKRFVLARSFENIPVEKRWKEALKFAEDIFKYELADPIKFINNLELNEKTRIEQLDLDYEEFESMLRLALKEKAETARPWNILKIANALYSLDDRTGQFSRYFPNPDDSLRTYAFNGANIDDEDLAITFVDIHT